MLSNYAKICDFPLPNLFPGPAQLSIACSSESWEGPGSEALAIFHNPTACIVENARVHTMHKLYSIYTDVYHEFMVYTQ